METSIKTKASGNAPKVTGRYNAKQSWEKQSVYQLSNGARAIVEYSHYGEMIARLDDAQGYWHCSSGIASLPERFSFALAWLEPYLPQITDTLIRPRFERS